MVPLCLRFVGDLHHLRLRCLPPRTDHSAFVTDPGFSLNLYRCVFYHGLFLVGPRFLWTFTLSAHLELGFDLGDPDEKTPLDLRNRRTLPEVPRLIEVLQVGPQFIKKFVRKPVAHRQQILTQGSRRRARLPEFGAFRIRRRRLLGRQRLQAAPPPSVAFSRFSQVL